MSTFYVTNEAQLKDQIFAQISRPLLAYLSEKVVKVMQKHLNESEISTRTLQNCVSYNIDALGIERVIEIDYDLAQTFAYPPQYEKNHMVEWGKFTNSLGANAGSQSWNGQWISFRLAEWLEYGGNGSYGNQPIPKSSWFTKTENEVKANLNSWVREFLHNKRLI